MKFKLVSACGAGARLKVMRHVQLGQLFTGVTGTGASKVYPAVDIGAGLNFELDTAELKPQVTVLWFAGHLLLFTGMPLTCIANHLKNFDSLYI